jgi:hypothetical protein
MSKSTIQIDHIPLDIPPIDTSHITLDNLQIIIGSYLFTLISYDFNDIEGRGSVKIKSNSIIVDTSIEEIFMGTNNLKYKHVYYLAGSDNNITPEININDTYEIGNIGWYTYDETIKLLRPYDKSKVDIVNQIYFFLISVIEKQKVINDINNNYINN